MRTPFLIRVLCDDPIAAAELAKALELPLRDRGARVRLSAEPRGAAGACVAVGMRDEDGDPRWLEPIDVDVDPAAMPARVVGFLEAWGFLHAQASSRRADRA